MTGFRADPQTLASRAGAFADLADRADKVAAELADALGGCGECWGGDEPGHAFAACHAGPAGAALQAVRSLPDGLRDVGSRLTTMAAIYADADSLSTGVVLDAGRGLG